MLGDERPRPPAVMCPAPHSSHGFSLLMSKSEAEIFSFLVAGLRPTTYQPITRTYLYDGLLGAEKWSSSYMDSARQSSCNSGQTCVFSRTRSLHITRMACECESSLAILKVRGINKLIDRLLDFSAALYCSYSAWWQMPTPHGGKWVT